MDGSTADLPFELQVRLGIGHDPHTAVAPTLDQHVRQRRLVALSTARQGTSVEATFRAALRSEESADMLIRALNKIEGVQSVTLQRITPEQEGTP
jgi:hypothetical protein